MLPPIIGSTLPARYTLNDPSTTFLVVVQINHCFNESKECLESFGTAEPSSHGINAVDRIRGVIQVAAGNQQLFTDRTVDLHDDVIRHSALGGCIARNWYRTDRGGKTGSSDLVAQ
jgi:hypothetical protein